MEILSNVYIMFEIIFLLYCIYILVIVVKSDLFEEIFLRDVIVDNVIFKKFV